MDWIEIRWIAVNGFIRVRFAPTLLYLADVECADEIGLRGLNAGSRGEEQSRDDE